MKMPDRIDLIATLLQVQIANIGYPVGCGVAPHPETLRKIAENVVAIADDPTASVCDRPQGEAE